MSATIRTDPIGSTKSITAGVLKSSPAVATPPHPRPHHKPAVPMVAWGHNSSAGLGLRHAGEVLRPAPGRLPAGTIDVQGGSDFSVALTSDGKVWCWGGNRWGQLGDGTTKHAFTPRQVKLPHRAHAVAIAVGQDHVLVLSRQGRVYAWGRNHHGQIGSGNRTDQHSPYAVQLDGHVRLIAAGNACSLALRTSGSLDGWGNSTPLGSTVGRLHKASHAVPESAEATAITKPRKLVLPSGTKVKAISAGQRHLVVLTRGGQLLHYGRTGIGRPAVQRLRLEHRWGRVVAISSGDNHTLALTQNHVVLAWGANHSGQLGLDSVASQDNPVRVALRSSRTDVVQVLANGNSSLVLTKNHRLYAWGDGTFGQQGRDSTDRRLRPDRVDVAPVTDIYAGRYHYLAVTR